MHNKLLKEVERNTLYLQVLNHSIFKPWRLFYLILDRLSIHSQFVVLSVCCIEEHTKINAVNIGGNFLFTNQSTWMNQSMDLLTPWKMSEERDSPINASPVPSFVYDTVCHTVNKHHTKTHPSPGKQANLAGVSSAIFNLTLEQTVISAGFKAATIALESNAASTHTKWQMVSNLAWICMLR